MRAEGKRLSFRHSGNLGDIIYSLPTVIAFGGGDLYIDERRGDLGIAPDAMPPEPMMRASIIQMCELLALQPYLSRVEPYTGTESADINLNKFREEIRYHDHLARVFLRKFGQRFDLSKEWLHGVEPCMRAEIVIAHSGKYVDHLRLGWEQLRGLEERCLFIGYEHEHAHFCAATALQIPKAPPMTILDFARAIRGCRLFVGNQSLGFALAEALKHPRVLEASLRYPNCIPQSLNGYTRLQPALHRFVRSHQRRSSRPAAEHGLVALRNLAWKAAHRLLLQRSALAAHRRRLRRLWCRTAAQ